ncbi:hypothetical protein [Stenotrophomonas maltophilia]|uniref:hypothetical protein n=1 Tax=Stenotrophomonas maltophilia TaxID=40324 RepID=UPI0006AC14E0|nr:hypothetical protein [Stenotrophomonas maltophilia]KOQ69959.1 hypothetical protein ABW43_07455 [Stenotrophomonas maltophilia]
MDLQKLKTEIAALTIVVTPLIRQRREDPNVQSQIGALTDEVAARCPPEEGEALRRAVRQLMNH